MSASYVRESITLFSGFVGLEVDALEGETVVYIVGTSDAEAQTLTYAIDSGDDASLFSIDTSDGSLSFNAAHYVDTPEDDDADNIYEVIVSVSDTYTTETRHVRVSVVE